MSVGYYERTVGRAPDGSPMYATDQDEAAEDAIAARLARAWGVEARRFGKLCPIDRYLTRDERLVALLEIKIRSHAAGSYPDVFLSVRKYLALHMAGVALAVRALYAIQWTDELGWIDVATIDASQAYMAGAGKARAIPSRSDREPVIRVPIESFTMLKRAEE